MPFEDRTHAIPRLPSLKPPRWRSAPSYPSVAPKSSSTARVPRMVYTGTEILGVATMHKSNTVPVTSREQALDIANMRRSRS
jgi:hypothetical protein